ncbi:ATP-grasp domain-containing protein [Nocardioides limicola]|uniref:ATP-grasp domain-containing protein n=1 Tax=Nocardioides limicola TaxID=2803368 RepID=UPI00193B41A0|nr:ATP-grasp domain-containing protein [Nocardioides sp. DJM-14]
MSRSALVLGALPGQADAMHRLRSAGWTVYACGHVADGPGVAAANEFFVVDIVDVDAVAALCGRLEVDVVYSVGSDIAMPTVAAVSERLGLPLFHSSEITETLHRKDLLRAFLADRGVSPVAHRVVRDESQLAGFESYPAIVKPVDSQGQRGITIVENGSQARSALPAAWAASRNGAAVIEELLVGPEVSVHVFVVDGRIELFLPSDRHVWDGPLTGIPSAHTMPSRILGEHDTAEIHRLAEHFIGALGVVTGPLYFQLIITEAGPRIVEVAPRLDGCHLWRLIEVHTGFDLLTTCFAMLTGEPWPGGPMPRSDDVHHTLRFHLTDPKVPFDPTAWSLTGFGDVVFEEFHLEPGELARDTNGLVARLGYGITRDFE